MSIMDYFRRSQPKSATVAKERLQIIVARERVRHTGEPDYLPRLKQELLQVISKYERIDLDQVSVNVERSGDCDVLELNVVLSESERAARAASRGLAAARNF
ncbi:cell division topological specificity factor [Sorangium cellulosum]|jgi:cell division topological specificity factor|uniref:Cell division topological specificity factor n=1 Tax=Sorangium cellulosum TaxID=56 RepID=A0A4P2Q053_SORCE|nr:cell division topological specificity factor MinE [Sorangium cellulosum]AUX22577.1 cell division topological specificity factor [Sorangium cellulosum]